MPGLSTPKIVGGEHPVDHVASNAKEWPMTKPNGHCARAVGPAADGTISAGAPRRAAKLGPNVALSPNGLAQSTREGRKFDRRDRSPLFSSSASHRTHATQYADRV